MTERVLINFMTANTGGIINCKRNVLACFNAIAGESSVDYFAIVAKPSDDEIARNTNLTYVTSQDVPQSFGQKYAYYERGLDEIAGSVGADILLNYGDIPAKMGIRQAFYFDWPYAVYDDASLWTRMRFSEFLSKAGKRAYFSIAARRADLFFVQTDVMRRRLLRKYPGIDIHVVDVGFDADEQADHATRARVMPEPPVLIYPTSLYPHKNLGILIEVAELLRRAGFPLVFRLTFDASSGAKEAAFCSQVARRGLNVYFSFLGRLSRVDLVANIQSATAIIMPTLIETYGLPYLEAQIMRKPMFTSRRDFAESLCEDAAYYFDPLDARDITQTIMAHIGDAEALDAKLAASDRLAAKRIGWSQSVRQINNVILADLAGRHKPG